MAPLISPKKSWESFAGSAVASIVGGVLLVVYLLDDAWWVSVALGAIAVVMATLGELCERTGLPRATATVRKPIRAAYCTPR